ncbi:hypothetical protein ACHMW5_13630 [Azospirillum melinis]|uniref:hypothetical protein n=1 Tax=Azospirillum melinis TaxID=328839 RepID=UPI0037584743
MTDLHALIEKLEQAAVFCPRRPPMAERSIIDTMARAIMEARDPEFGNGTGCRVIDWRAEARDNPHVAQAIAQARAALRSLIDAGPTEAMLAAAGKLESICARGNYGGTPTAEDLLDAMLRAALEEAGNHG